MKFRSLLEAGRKFEASDIHIVAGLPPAFRIDGGIVLTERSPLGAEEISDMVHAIISEEQKQILHKEKELGFSYDDPEFGRMRVTVYYSNGHPEVSVRLCPKEVLSAQELHLPEFIESLVWLSSGLVIITGPTGMGKTTTMNYIIDQINTQRRCKIITIEDPIEFSHVHKKSIIVQQEVHTDTLSFRRALIHALRQDPDVIAIGEMRDLETMQTALNAAETGHLVLATLHTPDATQTVERVISVFPQFQQEQVRFQFANTLQAAVAQKLLPRPAGHGRALACEILVATMAVRSIIRQGETHKLYSVVQTGQAHKMQTMDQALLTLYQQGEISYDTALNNATHPNFIESRSGAAPQQEKPEDRNHHNTR